ncbi:MAG: hypothetical protein P8Y14_23865 [Anaerolineales bacterium]
MKIQITIEEQILIAFRPSPAPSAVSACSPSMVNGPSSTFNLQPIIVPQTTNVEISAITNNSPRGLALKSQELYLFLEKPILNLFLLKNQQSFHSSIADSCA